MKTLKIMHHSLKLILTSKYLYLLPATGIFVAIFLAASSYQYPGDISVSPSEYSMSNGIKLANFFGCITLVFISINPQNKSYELELTKPITRYQYLLSQILGEIILPILVAGAILSGVELYLLFKQEPFFTEIVLAISLLLVGFLALSGFLKVISFFADDVPTLICGFLVALFSTQGFRAALIRFESLGCVLYIIPDLQTPELISLKYLLHMSIEWKYFLGPGLYAIISLGIAMYLFNKKDL
jgi:hypothetical protein